MRLAGSLLIALLTALAVAAGAGATARRPIPVLGFQPEFAPRSDIARNASVLSSVGVDGLLMTGPGSASSVDGHERAQIAAARRRSLRTQMLISNFSNRLNNFSEPLAYETLRSRELTARLARTLSADAAGGGWDGIMLDLESLRRRDTAGLLRLTIDLRHDLPPARTVAVTVSNNTNLGQFTAQGYDLKGLSRAGAQIVLMAYDDHGPWERRPGPVEPLAWQRAGIALLRRYVPARQLILGVAGYGYAWSSTRAYSVSDRQALQLSRTAGARTSWAARAGEWTSRLPDGTTIWWADARSFRLRVALARHWGLGGMAIWSLASTDRLRF